MKNDNENQNNIGTYKLLVRNIRIKKIIGLLGTVFCGLLLVCYIPLWNNKTLNSLIPLWVWLISPFVIAGLFTFSRWIVLFSKLR